MIVHRDASRQVDPALELSRCLTMRIDDLDSLTNRLLELGSLETALTDCWTPHRDSLDPRLHDLSQATRAAARALIDASDDGAVRFDSAAEQSLRRALSRCLRVSMPRHVTCKVPKGFAYHGVQPLAYDAAVRSLLSGHRPPRVLVVGLRTIGTTLGAIVAARCDKEGVPVRLLTVRPRGHPFDRRCEVDEGWVRDVAGQADASCLVVDEGPGLSGSSLTSIAELLEALGHRRDAIRFVCSHDPDPSSLRCERAKQRWTMHERLVAPLLVPDIDEEWSAGQWRARRGWPRALWPAVQPQHERHKGTVPGDRARLVKFIGLGPYGQAVAARASQAASAGFGVPILGFGGGFLHMTCLRGAPSPTRRGTPALATALMKYVPWRASTMQTGERADPAPLLEMLETNTRLHCGERLDAGLAVARARARVSGSQPAVIVDGHMAPWEWLATAHGLVKVDTAEHGDDHFLPGPQDIGWDVAAALCEFAWTRSERESLVDRLSAALHDGALRERLRWLVPCYLAARLGYASLAAESLDATEEGPRFRRLRDRYARQLVDALQT